MAAVVEIMKGPREIHKCLYRVILSARAWGALFRDFLLGLKDERDVPGGEARPDCWSIRRWRRQPKGMGKGGGDNGVG